MTCPNCSNWIKRNGAHGTVFQRDGVTDMMVAVNGFQAQQLPHHLKSGDLPPTILMKQYRLEKTGLTAKSERKGSPTR
jgi:hypothetical protein